MASAVPQGFQLALWGLRNRVWFRKFLLYAQHLLQRQPHPPSLSGLQQQLLVRRIGSQHVIQKHNVLARKRIKMVIRSNFWYICSFIVGQ